MNRHAQEAMDGVRLAVLAHGRVMIESLLDVLEGKEYMGVLNIEAMIPDPAEALALDQRIRKLRKRLGNEHGPATSSKYGTVTGSMAYADPTSKKP